MLEVLDFVLALNLNDQVITVKRINSIHLTLKLFACALSLGSLEVEPEVESQVYGKYCGGVPQQ